MERHDGADQDGSFTKARLELARIRSEQDAVRAAIEEWRTQRGRAPGERSSPITHSQTINAAHRRPQVMRPAGSSNILQNEKGKSQAASHHELEATLISTKLALAQLCFERDSLELELRSTHREWQAKMDAESCGTRDLAKLLVNTGKPLAAPAGASLSPRAPPAQSDVALLVGSSLHHGTLLSHDGSDITYEAHAARSVMIHENATNLKSTSLTPASERVFYDMRPLLGVLSVNCPEGEGQLHMVGFKRSLAPVMAELSLRKAQLQAERRRTGSESPTLDQTSDHSMFSPSIERDSREEAMFLLADDPEAVKTLRQKLRTKTPELPTHTGGEEPEEHEAGSVSKLVNERYTKTLVPGVELEQTHSTRLLTASRLSVLWSWMDAAGWSDQVHRDHWKLIFEQDFVHARQDHDVEVLSKRTPADVQSLCDSMQSFPVVLVIRSSDGYTFGAVLSCAPSSTCTSSDEASTGLQEDSGGSEATFVFAFGHKDVPYSHETKGCGCYYQKTSDTKLSKSMRQSISGNLFLGSSGFGPNDGFSPSTLEHSTGRRAFALWLDSSLAYGTSQACSTFGNPPLNGPESLVFSISRVEAWEVG